MLKKEEGFKLLTEFRLAGVNIESENSLIKFCQNAPSLEILDINNYKALGETGLNMICKALPKLKTIYMNFTENITPAFLDEARQNFAGIKFIRTIVKMSDPKDNNLYVPLPPKKLPKKKKKKGKKGKKK